MRLSVSRLSCWWNSLSSTFSGASSRFLITFAITRGSYHLFSYHIRTMFNNKVALLNKMCLSFELNCWYIFFFWGDGGFERWHNYVWKEAGFIVSQYNSLRGSRLHVSRNTEMVTLNGLTGPTKRFPTMRHKLNILPPNGQVKELNPRSQHTF